jgi:hypothetical protein
LCWKTPTKELNEKMMLHLRSVAKSLVHAEGVDEQWVARILSFTHNILSKLRPDVMECQPMAVYRFKENMDICTYARIKV